MICLKSPQSIIAIKENCENNIYDNDDIISEIIVDNIVDVIMFYEFKDSEIT